MHDITYKMHGICTIDGKLVILIFNLIEDIVFNLENKIMMEFYYFYGEEKRGR